MASLNRAKLPSYAAFLHPIVVSLGKSGPALIFLTVPAMNIRDAFIGVCLLAAGAIFLFAYYAERESNFLKALMWLCEKGSFPASRKMAFFYAGLCGLLGAIALLAGLGFTGASRQG